MLGSASPLVLPYKAGGINFVPTSPNNSKFCGFPHISMLPQEISLPHRFLPPILPSKLALIFPLLQDLA